MSIITQHTQGEWSIARRTPTEKRILVQHPDGYKIIACCSTGFDDGRRPIPEEERLANARLIAAAPQLLEALHSIEHLNQYHADAPFAADVLKICQSAISKATTP